MTYSALVSTRIDPKIRTKAIAKLKPLGLTLPAYIRLVFAYVVREQKLPPGFVLPDETKRIRCGK
jgi:antitoxin component of RelBE/YafQ-DinJ toxin-antitoxin module